MSTADPHDAPYASELQLLGQATGALDEVHGGPGAHWAPLSAY
jgi:hypothetical protein